MSAEREALGVRHGLRRARCLLKVVDDDELFLFAVKGPLVRGGENLARASALTLHGGQSAGEDSLTDQVTDFRYSCGAQFVHPIR